MNVPSFTFPTQPKDEEINILKELEAGEDFELVEGDSLILQECAGDKIDNSELYFKGEEYAFFFHHQNGRIFGYIAKKSNQDPSGKEVAPQDYLDWVEEATLLLNSNSLRSLLNLNQALAIINLLDTEQLI